MTKKIIFLLLCFLQISCSHSLSPSSSSMPSDKINRLEPIKKNDRILILAPHPDDETIGCAGIIQEALKAGAQVRVAYLTNGDHNQFAFIVYEKRLVFRKAEFIHLGEVRRQEAIKAMKLLGLDEKNLIFLGYPDFGTFAIFSKYWQSKNPFRSLLTRVSSVPYKENLSFGAPYTGESILSDLKRVLLNYKPTQIFVSHPADVNVDHKSFYLFLEVALADLSKDIPRPKVYPYLIHCVDWPLPRHYHPSFSLEPPKKFLDSPINWRRFELTPPQLNKKYRAILCYKSQTEASAFYLLSFCRKNELFGDYPEIELKKEKSLEGQVSYKRLDDSLVVRLEKPQSLKHKYSALFYLFGYSYKTPFANMPKLRIITKYNRFKVFDKKKVISPEGISLEFNPDALILRVSLKTLGNPDCVLTSVKTYTGNIEEGIFPFESTGFRKIEIK